MNMIKESKFNWCSSHKLCIMLSYYNFHLKKNLTNNGYSLFAEEVSSKPQYSEEFIMSLQFSPVKTLSHF